MIDGLNALSSISHAHWNIFRPLLSHIYPTIEREHFLTRRCAMHAKGALRKQCAFHRYDHSFPLRYKAQNSMKLNCH